MTVTQIVCAVFLWVLGIGFLISILDSEFTEKGEKIYGFVFMTWVGVPCLIYLIVLFLGLFGFIEM